MAYLKDSEGDALLLDDGAESWDAYISADFDRTKEICEDGVTGISLVVSIPEYLEDADGNIQVSGCLHVKLEDIFTEYLTNSFSWDGGVSLPKFSALLREYANKADARYLDIQSKVENGVMYEHE